MKKMFSVFMLIFALFAFPCFSETMVMEAKSVNEKIDFQQLFETSLENGDFLEYENTLLSLLQEENPEKDVFAEAIFYTFFYNDFSSEEETPASQIAELVTTLSSDSKYFSVIKFFKEKANSSLLKKFDIGQEILVLQEVPSDSTSVIYLENPTAERKSLLAAISEVEAMNKRFTEQAQISGEVLRFTDQAFIKTTEKPNLVFVMKNEPDYNVLYQSYLEAGKNIQGISFGQTPDAYYHLVSDLEKLDAIAFENGLILSNLFSDFTNSILKIYHTSPYVLTMLNFDQIDFVASEIDFVVNFPAFNKRITNLLKK